MSKEQSTNERNRKMPRGGGRPGGNMARSSEKAINFWPSFKRLLSELRPERARIYLVIAVSVISVSMAVSGPKILGLATDKILAGVIGAQFPASVTKDQIVAQMGAQHPTMVDMIANLDFVPGQGIDFAAIGLILGIALGLFLISGALQYGQGFVLAGVVQSTVYRLRRKVGAKLDRLPLSYFDSQPRGELLSRVTNDIDNVSQTMQQTMSQVLNSLLTVIGVLTMMAIISPTLAIVTLAVIPASMIVAAVIGKRSQKLFAAQWKTTGELNAHIEESFTGHSLVKVFGRRQQAEVDFAERNQELYQASFKAQFLSGIIMPTMFFIGNLNYVVIAVVGGLKVASGTMNIGDVQAFIQYSRQFTQPVTQLASMANLLQSGIASIERVFEVMDADEQSSESATALPQHPERITFENVSFSYSKDTELIRGLSLEAKRGETVAIVGPTGAGKTTLVNLLMRFYDLDGGRIALDGVDIAEASRADMRSRTGMVLQDTWLFGGTIRDNIAYGRIGATEDDIMAAAKATFVDRFVHSLPDGYDTIIDEEGNNVSAGEKQLITIARAFLADPAILILDEATSSVDTRTELLLQQAMARLRMNRTSFVIAHRLSTIRDASLVLVMENGAIVEQGTHDELIAREGAYYRLYQSQFQGPAGHQE